MRLHSRPQGLALKMGIAFATYFTSLSFSSESLAKSAVTPPSERPLEIEFHIQFGQRHQRLFFATSQAQSKLGKSQVDSKSANTRAVLYEHSSRGDFAVSVSPSELASLRSQIIMFLEQSKNAEPSKPLPCLDPLVFQVRNEAAIRRCRERMSRAQKLRFFQLVEKLSHFAQR